MERRICKIHSCGCGNGTKASGLLLSGLEIGRKEEAKMPFSIYRCLIIDYLEKHLIVV